MTGREKGEEVRERGAERGANSETLPVPGLYNAAESDSFTDGLLRGRQ